MDKGIYRTDKKKIKRIKKRKKMGMVRKIKIGILFLLIFLLGTICIRQFLEKDTYWERSDEIVEHTKPKIDEKLLTENPYSRPGISTKRIKGIVIHYTANPGATAMQNRNYFEGLKDSHATYASSNFIVGLDGEIVQCIPTWEVAYASNDRNEDTVSIETCPIDESGTYTKKTYRSMVKLTAWLCLKFDLTENNVIRHYDVTGKMCPKYFVEHEEKWEQFKKDVAKKLAAFISSK